jgi:hypothetical protein
MRRSAIPAAMLAVPWLVACVGTLVVRAPQVIPPHPESVLAQIEPLAIALPPATGAAAAADPVGERAGGWGRQGGAITATERPGDLVRRVVAQELEQAGHRIVERDADVALGIGVMEFAVDAPRVGRGWDVTVVIRAALRVEREPGSDDWSEFVYSTESTGRTLAPPGLSILERILGEAVRRFATLLAERDALAAALQRHARAAG